MSTVHCRLWGTELGAPNICVLSVRSTPGEKVSHTNICNVQLQHNNHSCHHTARETSEITQENFLPHHMLTSGANKSGMEFVLLWWAPQSWCLALPLYFCLLSHNEFELYFTPGGRPGRKSSQHQTIADVGHGCVEPPLHSIFQN